MPLLVLVPDTRSVHPLLAGIDTQAHDIYAALPALEEVSARLRARRDPRAIFPDLYGIITRNVLAAVEGRSATSFLEPAWIARLAGRFATRYFDALGPSLAGGHVASGAWTVAFDEARRGDASPVQHALYGIHAHINFDLAQGIADNVRGAGAADDPAMQARYLHDHDAVNAILDASMDEILDRLVDRYGCATSRLAAAHPWTRHATRAVVLAMLARWRTRVWGEMRGAHRRGDPGAHPALRHRLHAARPGGARAPPRAHHGRSGRARRGDGRDEVRTGRPRGVAGEDAGPAANVASIELVRGPERVLGAVGLAGARVIAAPPTRGLPGAPSLDPAQLCLSPMASRSRRWRGASCTSSRRTSGPRSASRCCA
jgi:hypothetical protein